MTVKRERERERDAETENPRATRCFVWVVKLQLAQKESVTYNANKLVCRRFQKVT